MLRQLEVCEGLDKGRRFSLNEGQTLQIGRGQNTETKLKDPRVSRVHCQVTVEDDKVILADAGGAGGTLLNGKPVTKQELRPGDVIRIGDTQMRFLMEDVHETSTVVGSAPSTPKPALMPAGSLTELVGKTLSHFEVGQVVAKGRSGVIFQAKDTKDNRAVALKVLLPEFSKNEEEMQRFVRAMKT